MLDEYMNFCTETVQLMCMYVCIRLAIACSVVSTWTYFQREKLCEGLKTLNTVLATTA